MRDSAPPIELRTRVMEDGRYLVESWSGEAWAPLGYVVDFEREPNLLLTVNRTRSAGGSVHA